MKFLNLLLVTAPLLVTSTVAAPAPGRGPLITVPGNFTAIGSQESAYDGIVQRLRKAKAHGNTTEVTVPTDGGKDSDSDDTENSSGSSGNSTTVASDDESGGNSTSSATGSDAASTMSAALTDANTGNATATAVSNGGSNSTETGSPSSKASGSVPSGSRDGSTAEPYGKNATSEGQSNSTASAIGNNSTTPLSINVNGNSTSLNSTVGNATNPAIDRQDDGTTVISWLPNAQSGKGKYPVCSVSIISSGVNGTQISTGGAPSQKGSANIASAGDGQTKTRCSTVTNINRGRESTVRGLISKKQKQLKQQRLNSQSSSFRHVLASQNITIPVVFHVITDGSKGELSDGDISKQMDVLNSDYKDYGFGFKLVNTSRVDNGTWFSGANYGSDAVYEMKTTLRQGGADTLNVYTVDFDDGTLGFATFPWDYADSPKEDGIVIQYSTLPGGSETGYNGGRTATHEAGHFLGLYHVFQGGCSSPGDYVDDTPPSASPTSGCPTKRDTCKGDQLEDAIHNYMDYSKDSCLTEFTEGQAVRMQAMTTHYRLGKNETTSA
ncbi:unnamed protein product [Sympodiomycopsis kandeliae]